MLSRCSTCPGSTAPDTGRLGVMSTDDGTTDGAPNSAATATGAPDSPWLDPATLTDRVVDTVDRIKAMTTDNAVLALRVVVFGLVISALAIAVLLLTIILLVRIFDAYLPIGAGVGDATWAAHGFTGIIFCVLGIGAWLSRRATSRPLVFAAIIDLVFVVVIICYGVFG